VLNALKSHDENLAFELDEIRTEMGKRKTSTGPTNKIPKVTIDLPKRLGLDFSESIKTILVENSTASWNFYYGLYERYAKMNKSGDVIHTYKIDGYNLGWWVATQKGLHKKGKLSVEKIKKLESLGIIWDTFDARWDEGFKYYEQYVKDNKSGDVIYTYKIDGYNLGGWVGQQKIPYKEGKLSREKIKKLESLGIIWDTFDARWDEGFKYYEQYVKDNKTSKVRRNCIIDGYRLGTWLYKQLFKYKEGKLSREKINKLESLGFTWKNHIDIQWDDSFELFKQYVKANKSAAVPRKYKFNNFHLGEWVTSQRKKYAAENLSVDKIKKLEVLGMVWKVRS